MGQRLSCAVHEAVAKSTEVDLMSWVMRRAPVYRQTCRHARETVSPHPTIAHTKDGRWVMANLGTRPDDGKRLIELLERYGIESGLDPEQSAVRAGGRFVPGTAPDQRKRDPAMEAVQRFVRSFTYANIPWREAQQLGMLWAPLRKPHENALDPHWIARKSVTDVAHPELGRSFRYATSKWIGTATGWSAGRRAPLLNEDAATRGRAARTGRAGDQRDAAGAGRRKAVAARQALSAERHPHPGFHLVPGLGRRHALPERVRRREHQGRAEEPSRTRAWPRWRRSAAAPRATRRPRRCPP